jgi:hypothetical protein
MPDHANTDSERPPLDAEDWKVVFQAYAEYPILAFILAQHFQCVKDLIQGGPQEAIQAITMADQAIDSLMPHTNFGDVDRNTYRLAVAGKLKPEHDETIRERRTQEGK